MKRRRRWPLRQTLRQTQHWNGVEVNVTARVRNGLTLQGVIPKIDVSLSTAFQSIPGANLAANYTYGAAQLATAFGRPATGVTTVNLVAPGTLQGDRINQIDLRAGKILRFRRYRVQLSLDLYNALNANPIQTYQQTFIAPAPVSGSASWLAPQGILPARFGKVTAQFDF